MTQRNPEHTAEQKYPLLYQRLDELLASGGFQDPHYDETVRFVGGDNETGVRLVKLPSDEIEVSLHDTVLIDEDDLRENLMTLVLASDGSVNDASIEKNNSRFELPMKGRRRDGFVRMVDKAIEDELYIEAVT